MAIELAYINTKHPDFADACGLMNNNIEVNTIWIITFERKKSVVNQLYQITEHGITVKHMWDHVIVWLHPRMYAEGIMLC